LNQRAQLTQKQTMRVVRALQARRDFWLNQSILVSRATDEELRMIADTYVRDSDELLHELRARQRQRNQNAF
jgi:hypothetical protein